MITTKHNGDPRSEQLNKMIRDACRMLQEEIENYSPKKDGIIDFIMENPDLPLTFNQIVFLLRNSYPAVSPTRGDFYDVYARLVSEAKALGDPELLKHIYLSVPFYPNDDRENQRKQAFFQDGIQYFHSLGLRHVVGELYVHLAAGMCFSTAERIRFCESALELLDPTSKEYACIRAMRDMIGYQEHQGNPDYYHYWTFGGTVFSEGGSIFLSSIFPCMAFLKRVDALLSNVVILKGDREWYESADSLDPSGKVKEIADAALPVGGSKSLPEEMELIRLSDETVVCRADGKEYLCRVFSCRFAANVEVLGIVGETHYFAEGIGLIRSVLSDRSREGMREYVYDLCDYTVKGGDGLLPFCEGNRWSYRQENCPDDIDQVIEREIISKNGEEYLLSGWNYAGRKPGFSCDANNRVSE